MMKRIYFIMLVLIALPLALSAQDSTRTHQQAKYGYFSYSNVLKSMNGYYIAKHNSEQLRNQYQAEAKRSEDDFNAKYEAFLDEQAELATNIRNKRQAELMDLMQKNQAFKTQAEKLIADAEKAANDSLCAIIDVAVRELGTERGYAFIFNTDNHSVPFVNPQYCEDVTSALEARLSKK